MERVWEELKEIESKAEQINSETMKKSQELIAVAKKDAEKLLSLAKKYAEAEANELLNTHLKKAATERDIALEKNDRSIKELKAHVEKNFDKTVDAVFNVVLGKIEV
jgi:vacuolar-type H+-ATPase subunit H